MDFQKLYYLRQKGIHTDIVIKIISDDINTEILAHKIILSQSEYFDKMFSGYTKETKLDKITMNVEYGYSFIDILNELYGQDTNEGNLDPGDHELQKIIMKDYLCLPLDYNRLKNLKVDNIDLLLRVADIAKYKHYIKDIIRENMKDKLVIPGNIQKILDTEDKYFIINEDRKTLLVYRIFGNQFVYDSKIDASHIYNFRIFGNTIMFHVNQIIIKYCLCTNKSEEIDLGAQIVDFIPLDNMILYIDLGFDLHSDKGLIIGSSCHDKIVAGNKFWVNFGSDSCRIVLYNRSYTEYNIYFRTYMTKLFINDEPSSDPKIYGINRIIFAPDDNLICLTNGGKLYYVSINIYEKELLYDLGKNVSDNNDLFFAGKNLVLSHCNQIHVFSKRYILKEIYEIANSSETETIHTCPYPGKSSSIIYCKNNELYSLNIKRGKKRKIIIKPANGVIMDIKSITLKN